MKKIFLPVLLLLTSLLHAQIPKPQKGTYVNDFAHVLTKSEITALNKRIFLIEKKTSVQLAVVLVKKIPAAYDIQDYALLIGRKWHVGKDRNGLVYVASILQHKQRIEVARRLDSIMTHERCMAIMADMKPYFRQKDYGSGLQVLVSSIDSTLAPQDLSQAATPASATSTKATNTSDSSMSTIVGVAVVILIIVLIVYLVRKGSRRTVNTNPNTYTRGQYNASGYNTGGQYNAGGYNSNYGNAGSSNHTVRDMATGAILGAAAGYAVRGIEDKLDNLENHHSNYNSGYSSGYNSVSDSDNSSNTDDNNSSNWGNWGSDSGSDSSSSSSDDSGFSDSGSSDSGGSSDW